MATVIVIAVALWIIVGFYPQRTFDDLGQAGVYGDSFGFVNSLFSSFAFAFIVLALLLQMKELHDTTKVHAEQGKLQHQQMKIAERTARIHALTYLAEWHYRMMRETQGKLHNANQKKSAYFGARAVALLRELGETFPDQPEAAEINVPTDAEIAISGIRKILSELEQGLQEIWDQKDTRQANVVFGYAQLQVREWIEKHRKMIDVRDGFTERAKEKPHASIERQSDKAVLGPRASNCEDAARSHRRA